MRGGFSGRSSVTAKLQVVPPEDLGLPALPSVAPLDVPVVLTCTQWTFQPFVAKSVADRWRQGLAEGGVVYGRVKRSESQRGPGEFLLPPGPPRVLFCWDMSRACCHATQAEFCVRSLEEGW